MTGDGVTAKKGKKAPMKSPTKIAKNTIKKAPIKTPQKQGWKTFLTVCLMLVWVGISVIASQYAIGILMLWILGADTLSQPVPTAIYSALSYVLAMFLIIVVPAKLSAKWKNANEKKDLTRQGEKETEKIDRDLLGLRGWPTWTDIGLAPVGFAVYLLLAAGITALFGLFPWFNASEAQDVGYSIYITGLDRVVAFLALVVVAPIAEEVIFRGWLYGKLREKTSLVVRNVASMIISSLLVSLLFGLIHMQWNVGVNVFAISLVLCALREITGTIYAGILLHILKNGVAFFMLYVLGIA